MIISTRLRLPIMSLVCAAAASTSVAAPATAPDPQKIFSRKDANSDGFLTLDEFKTGLKDKPLETAEKRFKKSDTDGDGKLSFEEFKAGLPKPKTE